MLQSSQLQLEVMLQSSQLQLEVMLQTSQFVTRQSELPIRVVLFNDVRNTFYLWLFGAGHICKGPLR